MIGIPVGLVFANAMEWVFHKHVLHGLGKRKNSFWSFHWHEHHRASRRHAFLDDAYRGSLLRWNAQSKEVLALAAGALVLLPLVPIAPFFVGTVWFCEFDYHRKHRRAHLEPEWAREHLPWHYAHHMGHNQDANWCVKRPWMDTVMGTRSAM
ncbi:MAG TPA: hypothetical protein VFV99_10995 [Kofleriaceae bacterium]|nr:hypothetical protein [Kofleriaceae bacterium]